MKDDIPLQLRKLLDGCRRYRSGRSSLHHSFVRPADSDSSDETLHVFRDMEVDQPSKTRILVADESSVIRKLLRLSLDGDDYEVVEAEDGISAFQVATTKPFPDIILLDSSIDGEIDGIEVCRMLKSDEQFRHLPIVMLTTAGVSGEMEDAVLAGADELLSKPINLHELQVRIGSIHRLHQAEAELVGPESIALALGQAIASKDGYYGNRVTADAQLAVSFGRLLRITPEEINTLRVATILRNIGKVAIPDSILAKTDPLTPRERAVYLQHPQMGCQICAPLKPLAPALPIIRHFKERFDGSGFPDALAGDEIPLLAQIVGIVDVFSELTNDRPNRPAVSQNEALEILKHRVSRGMHSPDLVGRFCKMILDASESPAGSPLQESHADLKAVTIAS
ncbi:response regulator [Stieleria sp. JC731]|uniref:HD-GYP domain-containing protein n=1 Tax=Pirellulaceae TaxID=2691357 RepID=UPI001E57D9C8|nr:HD domain-containing phosphohydrolase [Stieleria sp. JC731]MCC9600041.1 response regulator [Stieleria sp. JC731]